MNQADTAWMLMSTALVLLMTPALAASPIAGLAFVTTMLAPAATLLVWTLFDAFRSRKSTAVGAATAIFVGLVVVTSVAGFICLMCSILLVAIAVINL